MTYPVFYVIIVLKEDVMATPERRQQMELFPVFALGLVVVVLGAVGLTAYIAFKAIELP